MSKSVEKTTLNYSYVSQRRKTVVEIGLKHRRRFRRLFDVDFSTFSYWTSKSIEKALKIQTLKNDVEKSTVPLGACDVLSKLFTKFEQL